MKKLFKWLNWKWQEKRMLYHVGCHCGCCGKWIDQPFFSKKIIEWVVCPQCKN